MEDVVAINTAREDIKPGVVIDLERIDMTQTLYCLKCHSNTYSFNSTEKNVDCKSCARTIELPVITSRFPSWTVPLSQEDIVQKVKTLVPRSSLWYVFGIFLLFIHRIFNRY